MTAMGMPSSTGPVAERTNTAALSLVSIYEISKILTATVSLESSLRAVLNLMSSYMEMRRGVVAIVNADGTLSAVAAACLSPTAVESGAADLPEEVASRILSGQMPFVTEDVAEHPLLADYVGASGALDDERVSFIGVPIKTVGRPFGVLAVARLWSGTTEVSFGDDVRFLTMVANLIAQTVKLHQRVAFASQPGCAKGAPPPPRPRVSNANRGTTLSIDSVVGVAKAYVTRVGEGPFPTEIDGPDEARVRELGEEYGTTTGRERRCGWLDLVALRFAVRVNGMTSLALTKLDVLSDFAEIPVCTRYRLPDGSETDEFPAHQSDFHHARPVYETLPGWREPLDEGLPPAARSYVQFVESALELEVSMIGTGADRERVITRDQPAYSRS